MGFWDDVRKKNNETEKRQLEKAANKKLQQLLKHRETLNNEFFGAMIRREMPTLEQDIEQLKQALKKQDHDKIKRLLNNLPSLKQDEKLQTRGGIGALLFAGPILLAFFSVLIIILVFFLILIF
ncbi:MAG TPA: hypothetical protein VMW40_08300 [Candidatus Bathyarchaeia archaeon]|nr:hypothetical protein [Candidatus Bathyarchaeia archaeon]